MRKSLMILSSTKLSFSICFLEFFCIVHRNGVAFAQPKDSQEMCNDEYKTLAKSNMPDSKCFDCTSKEGLVECKRKKCFGTEGCYMLQLPSEDQCCPKCKGCTNNGKYYKSGSEWIEFKDPCKLFMCTAGAITESRIQCYVPCNEPIPPAHGKCCPTCPDCLVDGKKINNATLIMPDTDSCVSCECETGKLVCSKKACPVLNCPESKIVRHEGECCSKCLGSRELMDPPKGACILSMKLYQSEKHFTVDDCTECSCKNSTVHCRKENCPILKCKREYQKLSSGKCCAQCSKYDDEFQEESENNHNEDVDYESEFENHKIDDEKNCEYNNKTHENGETWTTPTCKNCTCMHGKINCSSIKCPAINCPSNSVLKIPEAQCCPICVESEGVCTVFGGTHFRTFDGKVYAFIGSCKYQLISDCDDETFSIQLKNSVKENDVMIKRVSLKLDSMRVDFQQNKNIKVNDRVIDLPYKLRSKISINGTKENIVLSMKSGLKILWNHMGFLEITVPNSYRKKVCGLCGNFNAVTDDDLTTREGITVKDPAIFAQSWTAGDDLCFETKKYGIRGCNPHEDQRLCSYIKGSAFEKCLKKLNVKSYYETCLKDMCECPPEDIQCHCESFSSYVHDCFRLGILLPNWRASVGC